MEPSKYHQIETWVDLNEILTKQSSVMQPWTQAAANYEQLIFKFLYSSMKTVLQFDSPEGARVSSENVHNAGMFASMPKLQIAEGKHLLRDYGNMTPAIWKKMSAKLDAKYVLYKTRYKIVVTNLGDELITGDSESPITIIPPKNIFSPIHVVANVIMKKSNPEEGQILPLSQVVQYDDKTDSIVNTVTQGSLIGTGLIYF